jgi:hypothetical protein
MRHFVVGLVVCASVVLAGTTSLAGATGKFAYSEEIQFPSGDLLVVFEEGGQKRFSSVDYRLDATVQAISCQDPDHCIATIADLSNTVTGLVPDAKGRVTGNVGLDRGSGGGICTCTLHMDYTNVTLTNLASGHVYRLDPISADAP